MSLPVSFAAFRREVLDLYAPPIRRGATRAKMRQVLEEFEPLCPTVGDLKPPAIAAWVAAHPGRRPATVDSLLRSLRAAINYASKVGYLTCSPLEFRGPRAWVDWDVPELPPPVHSAADIARVLDQADREALAGDWRAGRLRTVVYLGAFTGARKRELLGLLVDDVDLDAELLEIRTNHRRRLKTRASSAVLPLSARLTAVLADWLPRTGSEWLIPGAYRKGPWLDGLPGRRPLDQLQALGVRAGVAGLTFQSFRHTFATLSEGWGLSELGLQRMLRHTRLRTQRSYRHPLPEVLRGVAARVSYA